MADGGGSIANFETYCRAGALKAKLAQAVRVAFRGAAIVPSPLWEGHCFAFPHHTHPTRTHTTLASLPPGRGTVPLFVGRYSRHFTPEPLTLPGCHWHTARAAYSAAPAAPLHRAELLFHRRMARLLGRFRTILVCQVAHRVAAPACLSLPLRFHTAGGLPPLFNAAVTGRRLQRHRLPPAQPGAMPFFSRLLDDMPSGCLILLPSLVLLQDPGHSAFLLLRRDICGLGSGDSACLPIQAHYHAEEVGPQAHHTSPLPLVTRAAKDAHATAPCSRTPDGTSHTLHAATTYDSGLKVE